jgi:small GTP-binding protein
MKKTIGMIAHVDAGKTTLVEQLLYHTKSIRTRGRVDHKDAFLDNHEIEKQRGITVFADQAMFSYNGSDYYLIDTPGHIDFSPEMERSILVMDYAIVIISAVEGVESHTETVWILSGSFTFFSGHTLLLSGTSYQISGSSDISGSFTFFPDELFFYPEFLTRYPDPLIYPEVSPFFRTYSSFIRNF